VEADCQAVAASFIIIIIIIIISCQIRKYPFAKLALGFHRGFALTNTHSGTRTLVLYVSLCVRFKTILLQPLRRRKSLLFILLKLRP